MDCNSLWLCHMDYSLSCTAASMFEFEIESLAVKFDTVDPNENIGDVAVVVDAHNFEKMARHWKTMLMTVFVTLHLESVC